MKAVKYQYSPDGGKTLYNDWSDALKNAKAGDFISVLNLVVEVKDEDAKFTKKEGK